MIKLFVLDELQITGDDPDLAGKVLTKLAPTALLIYLAVDKPGAFRRREGLLPLFWPHNDQAHGLANLRKLIFTLREVLGPAIETRGDHDVRVDPAHLWCDAAEFQKSLAERRLARAVELYQSPFATGVVLNAASGDFERWVSATRGYFAREAVKAVIKLAETFMENSEATAASDLIRSIIRVGAGTDDERLFLKLLGILQRSGERVSAFRLCEEYVKRLRREGVEPSAELEAFCKKLRAG